MNARAKARSVKLHAKLYRALAIDDAMALTAEGFEGAQLSRRRDGDHYVVEVTTQSDSEAAELLAEVADAALVLTAERDKD